MLEKMEVKNLKMVTMRSTEVEQETIKGLSIGSMTFDLGRT